MRQPTPSATDLSLGARLVAAIAARDTSAFLRVFATPVTFRAVTPLRFWDADTAIGVADIVLGTWFSSERAVTDVLRFDRDTVLDLSSVAYRLAVATASGPAVIEQVAYYREQDGRITDLRLVCSGFVPLP